MSFTTNDGSHPDLQTLGLRVTDEQEGPVPDEYQKALAQSAAALPPLDVLALRRRAEALPDPDPIMEADAEPVASPPSGVLIQGPWGRRVALLAPVAMAAAALFFVRGPTEAPAPAWDGIKGGAADLSWYVEQDGEVRPGDGDLDLAPGSRLQLEVYPGPHDQMVLLSIDGAGTVSWILPSSPEQGPVPVEPHHTRLLDFALELDEAPGPEVFVAAFGASVDETEARVVAAWEDSPEALQLLADDPSLDVIVVHKEH